MVDSEIRFKVVEQKFGANLSYMLLDGKSGEFVSVLPHLGGSIQKIALRHQNDLIEITDCFNSEGEVEKSLEKTFKGSNLFPYPNRVENAKYNFNNSEHFLPVNFPDENIAIHGLIYNKEFKVIDKESGEIGCVLILEYENTPSTGYPFHFLMKIIYRLTESSGFSCEVKISNVSDQSIPVGQGWHPYFTAGSELIDDLELQFPANTVLVVDGNCIPTGFSAKYRDFNTPTTIENTSFDNCFTLITGSKKAEINLRNRELDFGYTIWVEMGKYKYNYLQIYTPPGRKSIAIAPMTCAPNALNSRNGLVILRPMESTSTSWGISHGQKKVPLQE